MSAPSLTVHISGPEGPLPVHRLSAGAPVWLGRETTCQIVLPSALVSRRHVQVEPREQGMTVADHSANGTWLNGARLLREARDTGPVASLRIGPYRVRLQLGEGSERPAPKRDDHGARRRLRHQLLEVLDLPRLDVERLQADKLGARVRAALEAICDMERIEKGPERAALVQELSDEVLGLGPLQALLADPEVSEIMVVDPTCIYAERRGRLQREPARFTDGDAVQAVLERIVTPLGRRIDESSPLVDARLADGSRVNAVIPPLSTRGACITIRKFGSSGWDLPRLEALGALDRSMARMLDMAVRCRKNIVIAGGTGSGKTTLLNALSASIPEHERVVTIEDAAELQLAQEHVVTLEARPANMEGRGAYSIRDLLKNALRMRPDRIVVGECRGGEAIDMLQAMNTGHEGSMTTTHANSPNEAVARLETLVLMSGVELPMRAIRRQIGASLHLIVQQARLSDGRRLVTHISEVCGVDDEGDIRVQDIFRFIRTGTDAHGAVSGHFAPTGYLPSCLSDFITHGLLQPGEFL